MTARKVSAFVDAIVHGRRPSRFQVEADDVDVLRAAIELRAARPGDSAPTAAFTDGLFRQLSDQLGREDSAPAKVVVARPRHRVRLALIAASVAAVLVAGTAIVTETVSHRGTTPQRYPTT